MTDTAIYVQFSDCRQHIRKWSREPFEGGHRFMDQGCYVIWSNEHRAWWGPERRGYVTNLAEAGIYGRDEANLIARNAKFGSAPGMPNEIALPVADAEAQQL